jgi:hypothetical protein
LPTRPRDCPAALRTTSKADRRNPGAIGLPHRFAGPSIRHSNHIGGH